MPRKKTNDLLNALFATVKSEAETRRQGDRWFAKAEHLRACLMPIQARLEQDRSRWKAVRSPRQTGKSTGVMFIVSIRCFEKALSQWIVVCVTRKSAKSIYWEPLKFLNQQMELGITFQNQDLEATFPNGSKIRFVGADNMSEIEKLRGGRYDGVIIDECKSYPTALLDELIGQVLEPALMAMNGEIILIGTPGDHLKGTFYLATCDDPVVYVDKDGRPARQSNAPYEADSKLPAMWSFHKWTLPDNTTRFPDGKGGTYSMWDQAQTVMAKRGWDRTTPEARREYFGEWVPSDDKRVYRYRPNLHDYDPSPATKWGIPALPGGYKTVIAVDLGTRDGTGIVVWAWNEHRSELWEVFSGKKARQAGERLPLSEIAEWYHELEEEFGPFVGWPSDPGGLATMVHDTLADEYDVFLEPADKHEKNDAQEIMNQDFDSNRIHIIRGSMLSDELDRARWDVKMLDRNKKVEDGNIPNDVADAGLYGHRWCNHRRPTELLTKTPMYTPEWWKALADKELSDAQKQAADKAYSVSQGDIDPNRLDQEWW